MNFSYTLQAFVSFLQWNCKKLIWIKTPIFYNNETLLNTNRLKKKRKKEKKATYTKKKNTTKFPS